VPPAAEPGSCRELRSVSGEYSPCPEEGQDLRMSVGISPHLTAGFSCWEERTATATTPLCGGSPGGSPRGRARESPCGGSHPECVESPTEAALPVGLRSGSPQGVEPSSSRCGISENANMLSNSRECEHVPKLPSGRAISSPRDPAGQKIEAECPISSYPSGKMRHFAPFRLERVCVCGWGLCD
jgi:hypothetical protein